MKKNKNIFCIIFIAVIMITAIVTCILLWLNSKHNSSNDAFEEFHSSTDTESSTDNLVSDIENSVQGNVSNIEELDENNLDYFDSYYSIDSELNQESVESLMPCITDSGVSREDYAAIYTGLVNTFDVIDNCVRSSKKIDVMFSYMMSYVLDVNDTSTVYICIDYENGIVYVKQI